jgi:hypothetical protein
MLFPPCLVLYAEIGCMPVLSIKRIYRRDCLPDVFRKRYRATGVFFRSAGVIAVDSDKRRIFVLARRPLKREPNKRESNKWETDKRETNVSWRSEAYVQFKIDDAFGAAYVPLLQKRL